MSVFKKQIIINNEGKLNKTQESLFNEMLESAVDVKQDPRYGDDEHQIIYMKNGDQYYFDSYKYIYPIKAQGYAEVINNNVGPGEIVSVGLYEGSFIRVEHYIDDQKMTRSIYELPKNVQNLSAFLLQVGSLHPVTLGKLNKVSEIIFVKENDEIMGYDEQQNIFYNGAATNSFFDDAQLGVNYCMNKPKQF